MTHAIRSFVERGQRAQAEVNKIIARARLNDAAPELLEALKCAYAEIHNPGTNCHDGRDIDALCAAAIAKAEGKS